MMGFNKAKNLVKLAEIFKLSHVVFNDEYLFNDLKKAEDDDTCVFKFSNSDRYSGLCINYNAAGSNCMAQIVYDDTIEDNDEIAIELFAQIMLNRYLEEEEEDVLIDAMKLCELADTVYDELHEIIKTYTRADDTIDAWILYPVQLFLFLLFAEAETKKNFFKDFLDVLNVKVDFLKLVNRYI